MTIRIALAAMIVLLTAGTVRAEDCPDEIPDDNGVRREQAKKWFTRGQTAASDGDDITALKAYQCSLKFVPHGFTAYNIAQIAERIGDLEMAIASYSQYLLLVPEAKDAQDVSDKIVSLKDRLAQARQKEKEIMAAAPDAKATSPGEASAGGGTSATEGGANVREQSGQTGATEAPAGGATAEAKKDRPAESIVEEKPPTSNLRKVAYLVYGGAGVALAAGLIANLLARSKMNTCRSEYDGGNGDISAAESACSDAKALAYTSYALFGLGAAAAVVGTVLVLRPTPSSEVALNLLPEGGMALGWGGRF
jgi:tetratricopeptide (TPR) repeat protein